MDGTIHIIFMKERPLNSGEMPRTDFHYEEFEGLLSNYYLGLLPLKEGEPQDRSDFESITGILNGFAERHGVQTPEEAVAHPRLLPGETEQFDVIDSCFSIIDSMRSFRSDFGVGMETGTVDLQERFKLGRLILGIMHRHGVIQAEFEEIDGAPTPVRVLSEDKEKIYKPLQEILGEN